MSFGFAWKITRVILLMFVACCERLHNVLIKRQPWVMLKKNNTGQMLQSTYLDHPDHWEYLAKKTQPCLNLLSQLSIFSQQDYKHDHHSMHVSAENIKSMFGKCISFL